MHGDIYCIAVEAFRSALERSCCLRKSNNPLMTAWKEGLLSNSSFLFSYLSWGWANDPAVYTDCTMLNTPWGHKIDHFMQAINNSLRCFPTHVKQKG